MIPTWARQGIVNNVEKFLALCNDEGHYRISMNIPGRQIGFSHLAIVGFFIVSKNKIEY
jgi:hypothetical protein